MRGSPKFLQTVGSRIAPSPPVRRAIGGAGELGLAHSRGASICFHVAGSEQAMKGVIAVAYTDGAWSAVPVSGLDRGVKREE
jgi:hypothetical protein